MQLIFRLLSVLPLPVLHAGGWLMGWASFVLSGRYRRRLLANARQAGLSLRTALVSVGESGKMVAETPRLWLGKPMRMGWEGASVVESALTHGSGVLFLTPHLGCFEITAQALAQRFGERMPITVLFRPSRQPALRDLVATARERPHLFTAPTTLAGVKQLIKALKSQQAVGLLPDQVPPAGQGVWAPFFGREAYTMTLSARLAQTAGVQLVLIWGERLSWGRGYLVHVRPCPVEGGLSRDPLIAATQINQAMEALVRECPAQYIWSYDRYKTPHGLAATDAGTARSLIDRPVPPDLHADDT
ncbi:lysophospholipid acyltransferase family protein [Hydrogenophaga sp. PAMC20947]|nr:lysophospholipid acyltransferase family protein [Hydrogenophaga sp. PAMC20947]